MKICLVFVVCVCVEGEMEGGQSNFLETFERGEWPQREELEPNIKKFRGGLILAQYKGKLSNYRN